MAQRTSVSTPRVLLWLAFLAFAIGLLIVVIHVDHGTAALQDPFAWILLGLSLKTLSGLVH